jgi:hypothetical protein
MDGTPTAQALEAGQAMRREATTNGRDNAKRISISQNGYES